MYLNTKLVRTAVAVLLLPFVITAGPLTTHLEPETDQQFQHYATSVEAGLSERWNGNNGLEIERMPEELKKVMQGQVVVRPSIPNTPVDVHDGLVHDWTGDIFIPNVTIAKLIGILEDFDHDADMFPDILKSRLIAKNDNHVTGYWRVEHKAAMLDVVLDIYNDTQYSPVAGGRWSCTARTEKIQQVEGAGTTREKLLPPGQGYGFLWRMNNYWTFESRNGGVLIECRNLSLSRSVPGAVSWMINSMIKQQPKISMTSTLLSTRKAAEGTSGKG